MNNRQKWGIAAATLVLFTAGGVGAAQGTAAKKNEDKRKGQAAQTGTPGAGQSRQRTFVDPATGRTVEPTPEQIQALEQAVAEMLSQSTEGLEPVEQPDGTIMLDLDGRFQEIAIATVAPGGEVSVGCVDHPRQVKQVLQRKLRPSAKPAPAAEVK